MVGILSANGGSRKIGFQGDHPGANGELVFRPRPKPQNQPARRSRGEVECINFARGWFEANILATAEQGAQPFASATGSARDSRRARSSSNPTGSTEINTIAITTNSNRSCTIL